MNRKMTPMEKFSQDIAVYIRWRDDQLQHCRILVERKIEKDKLALFTKQKEKHSDASIGRLWHHLEYTLCNTFRYTLLSGACSILEESVKAIAEKHFPDENKRKKELRKSENVVRKQKGYQNWLESYIHLISTLVVLKRTSRFETDLKQFTDVITLRNCIVHSWGNVEKTEYPKQLREAVQRIRALGKKENSDFAAISPDGYLVLGDDMVAHATCLAVPIVDFLCLAMIAQEAKCP